PADLTAAPSDLRADLPHAELPAFAWPDGRFLERRSRTRRGTELRFACRQRNGSQPGYTASRYAIQPLSLPRMAALAGSDAAIHRPHAAGGEGRCWRGREENGLGDLHGLGDAAEKRIACPLPPGGFRIRRAGHTLAHHLGIDRAGADADRA